MKAKREKNSEKQGSSNGRDPQKFLKKVNHLTRTRRASPQGRMAGEVVDALRQGTKRKTRRGNDSTSSSQEGQRQWGDGIFLEKRMREGI